MNSARPEMKRFMLKNIYDISLASVPSPLYGFLNHIFFYRGCNMFTKLRNVRGLAKVTWLVEATFIQPILLVLRILYEISAFCTNFCSVFCLTVRG